LVDYLLLLDMDHKVNIDKLHERNRLNDFFAFSNTPVMFNNTKMKVTNRLDFFQSSIYFTRDQKHYNQTPSTARIFVNSAKNTVGLNSFLHIPLERSVVSEIPRLFPKFVTFDYFIDIILLKGR